MRLYLAVPASHMQEPVLVGDSPTGVLAGDSLTGHFADFCPISMRQGVPFVPLTRTPEAAVTLAEYCERKTQMKRWRGSPTAPLERMTTSCEAPGKKQKSPPPRKKQGSKRHQQQRQGPGGPLCGTLHPFLSQGAASHAGGIPDAGHGR